MGFGGSKAAGGLSVTDKVNYKNPKGTKPLPCPKTRHGNQRPRSLMNLPGHVATEHVVGFLDVIGLIRLSATCRRWYAVRRTILQTKFCAERAAPRIQFAGSLNFSPHRAHRYALWLSMCPRPLVEAIVDRYGKEYPTDVLEAMIMTRRKKTWPWMDDYHALVFRDVMFWCGAGEVQSIRCVLQARTLAYTEGGILDEPYKDVFFADRVVSTEAEWEAFKGEWFPYMGQRDVRLFDVPPPTLATHHPSHRRTEEKGSSTGGTPGRLLIQV